MKHGAVGGELSLRLPRVDEKQTKIFEGSKFQQLSDLRVGEYGWPSTSNFRVVDFLLLLSGLTVLFQATVAGTHGISENGLRDLLKNLPASASRNVAFLFVVPEFTRNLTNFADFTVNEVIVQGSDSEAAALAASSNLHGRRSAASPPGPWKVAIGVLAVPMAPDSDP